MTAFRRRDKGLEPVVEAEEPPGSLPIARDGVERLRAIYTVSGAPARCRLHEGDGDHRCYKAPVWPIAKELLYPDSVLASRRVLGYPVCPL